MTQKEDLQEISAVHEAVRSLIDYREHQRPEESQERYAERMGADSATLFENFCSAAIRRHSGLGHIGYIEPGKLRDINVAGYLLVRSMVGRWEKTLGRRLDPIRAIKLLLDATRNGTSEALPAVDVDVADFQNEANSRFQKWLVSLATLDNQTLECFFESVQPGVKGHQYYWTEGKPRRVSDDLRAAQSVALGYLSKLQEMCIQLVMGVGAGKNEGFGRLMLAITEKDKATILNLLNDYLDILGLLPVGRDMARLLFIGDEGRAVVCPRTYTGLTVKSGSESWPRYSIRSLVLQGGAAEVSRLRGLCAKARSARVLTTRVLDLVGHPESPLKRPNMSYVCHLLDSSWHRITIGDSFTELGGEQNAFIEVIKKRLHPRPFFRNEGQTLASCDFLASRLQSAVPNSPIANLARAFIRLECSRDVAFGSLAQALPATGSTSTKKAFDDSMVEGKTRRNIAEYLCLTGRGQSPRPDHPALSSQLGQIAFTDNFSGIVPFGG